MNEQTKKKVWTHSQNERRKYEWAVEKKKVGKQNTPIWESFCTRNIVQKSISGQTI